MEPSHVKGLIGSVGKAFAEAPTREKLFERLEAVGSREAFRALLEDADLGIMEPSRSQFINAVTAEDAWVDWHSQLKASADNAWHEFRSPSS